MIDFISGFTNIISVVTVVQLLSFSSYLIFLKRKDLLILAFFLIANALFILNFVIKRQPTSILFEYPDLIVFGFPFGFLFGSLLYFYSNSIIKKKFEFSGKKLLHFLPFVLIQLYFLFHFHFQGFQEKLRMINNHDLIPLNLQEPFFIFLFLMNSLYCVYILYLIKKSKDEAKENFSSIEHLNINWLKTIVLAFFLMWIVDFINYIFYLIGIRSNEFNETFLFISLTINFVFANIILFKGWHYPTILHEELKTPGLTSITEKPKYESSSLTEKIKLDVLSRLKEKMIYDKPYLNPDLTLNELATSIDVHYKTLSQVINEKLGMNFYDFVNQYRIEEACNRLSSPQYNKDTILAILLDSGFNSKSVFNTIFKKSTGVTPSQYRKRNTKAAI